MITLNFRKKMADSWFSYLQSQICKEFEYIENNRIKFKKRNWNKIKKSEGGGVSFLLKDGKIFDKVGVNKSTVSGIFPKQFRSKILGAERQGKYWASGVSVVAHMKNPKVPAIHFNTRYIVTSEEWFGGGMDVTPSFKDIKEKEILHSNLKKVCTENKKDYKKYKKWCDKYFYLPHRKEARGIGGIFFDHLNTGDWKKDFNFVKDVGLETLKIISEIVSNKKDLTWSKEDKEKQLLKRGRYVEFNLIWDRGTLFGLKTGGSTEAIMMSMPPEAKWD